MAIFSTIDGKSIKTVTYSELETFLVSYVFNSFMDSGRTGLVIGARVSVVNVDNWLAVTRGTKGADDKTIDDLVHQVERRLMDTFITKGTSGIGDVIKFTCSSLAYK